jgi:hypothetical protein
MKTEKAHGKSNKKSQNVATKQQVMGQVQVAET